MSKNNNVNPGQYKVAGREKPDDIARERMKTTRQPVKGSRGAQMKQNRKSAR